MFVLIFLSCNPIKNKATFKSSLLVELVTFKGCGLLDVFSLETKPPPTEETRHHQGPKLRQVSKSPPLQFHPLGNHPPGNSETGALRAGM